MVQLNYIKQEALAQLEAEIHYHYTDFGAHKNNQEKYVSLKTVIECIDLIEKNR